MKKRWLILFLVIFLIPFSFANTLNVPINYTTIQDAINNASIGDVINVSAGTYDENLVIDKTIELVGSPNLDTIIQPTNTPSFGVYDVEIDADDVVIENLFFDFNGISDTRGGVSGDTGIVVCDLNEPPIKNVKILNNIIYTGDGDTSLETGKNCDVSGLLIQGNKFYGDEDGSGEAIYINPFLGTKDVTIRDNEFYGNLFSGVSIESSRVNVINNTFNSNTSQGNYGIRFISFDGNKTYNDVEILENNIQNFIYGIRIGSSSDVGSIFTAKIEKNILTNNDIGVWVRFGVNPNTKINFNEIFNNTDFGVDNADSNVVNAENNWWGSCDGPSGFGSGNGDAVSSNVTFSNWLGACVENAVIENSCVLETDNVTLYANVSSQFCIGDVTFSIYSNGNWTNYAGVENSGAGNYSTLINSNFSNGGEWINWTVYVEDCYGHTIQNGIQSFYVNSPTSLSIEPSSPDGLNGWYISEPEITLTNLDATNIWYRWDSTGTKNYVLPFKLEDSPNNGNITGGIMELNYWSDICGNESENSQILKVDFKNPSIINLIPFGEVVNNLMPLISAYLDEVYQSNSGINTATIQVLLDGIIVPINISLVGDLDANVNYLPVTNLSEGLHNVTINVTDNAGRTNNVFWEFNISISPIFDFQINSPMDEIYEDKKIVFNISASEELDLIEYKELNDGNSKWKKICSDCEEYGYSHKRTKIFSDGEHNLSIRATDYYSQVKEENISIFIDSTAPKISKNLPKKNAVTNGSDFYIKFKEENPINLTLYFNGTYDVDLENECDFDGRYYECDFDVNLINHDGEEIEYWFNLTDVAGNFDESKLTNVKVDTTSPILNNESYWVRGTGLYWNYVYFTFNVTEENFDEISYSYLDSKGNLKERKLCSKLKNGICETRKKIYVGEEIGIKILDDAGNSWIDEFVA